MQTDFKENLMNLNLIEYTLTGFCGLTLSVIGSIICDVPPPPQITVNNIINLVTQLTILSGTIFGFYIKYKEYKNLKKKK